MGVVESTDCATRSHSDSKILLYGVIALYACLVAAMAAHHESWADEAQSWLLARDAGLPELWTRLLHYEGTPGLWQTILHLLIRVGLPYEGLSFVSAAMGVAATWILVRFAPLPLPLRLVLPFSYFFCYQYAVVARSYCLLPPLLFLAAVFFHNAVRRLTLFTALLILIAAVSVHGFVLSIAIAIAAAVRNRRHLRSGPAMVAAIVYCAALVCLGLAAMPVADGTFVSRANPSLPHFFDIAADTFAQAITGEPWTSFALTALSVPFLWRGGGWLVFALSALFLCGVNAVIYSQMWHMGLLFPMWIFAIWISAEASAHKPDRRRFDAGTLTLLSVSVAASVLCFCTIQAAAYDWLQPYSGSKAASRFLKDSGIPGHSVYGIGYASVAVQPYFQRNLFANFHGGAGPAYWDWSNRNRSLEELDRLSQLSPDYVVLGYTNLAEKVLWSHDIRAGGYERIGHFDGNLFWRTGILEPATFDVYRRRGHP